MAIITGTTSIRMSANEARQLTAEATASPSGTPISEASAWPVMTVPSAAARRSSGT